MSIVLEALAKAQKEGQVFTGLNVKSTKKIVNKQENSVKKQDIAESKTKRKLLNSIYILWLVLTLGIVTIFYLKTLDEKQISNIFSFSINKSSLSKPKIANIPIIKNVFSVTPPDLQVTGIILDEKAPIALINGKFLKENDEILNAKIVKIQQDSVIIVYKNKEFVYTVE